MIPEEAAKVAARASAGVDSPLMPRVVDYDIVSGRMRERGFVSLYHNSGAFGFAAGKNVLTRGWIGPDDPTIRDAARGLVRQYPPPFEENLAAAFASARKPLQSDAWLMPKSHWHYEMQFGNRELLEALLPDIGLDPADLRDRNNGAAIEFSTNENDALQRAVRTLLGGLVQSDFLVAFPDAATLCTIHHHKQLWWQTTHSGVSSL
jgi:hypothetical protein